MKRIILIASMLACTSIFAHDFDPLGLEKEHFAVSMSRAALDAQARPAQTPFGIRIDDAGRSITSPSTTARAQVAAETRAAARFGLLRHDELGPVQATVEQERQIKQAGQRAIGQIAAGE
jgi:hypothetical protein